MSYVCRRTSRPPSRRSPPDRTNPNARPGVRGSRCHGGPQQLATGGDPPAARHSARQRDDGEIERQICGGRASGDLSGHSQQVVSDVCRRCPAAPLQRPGRDSPVPGMVRPSIASISATASPTAFPVETAHHAHYNRHSGQPSTTSSEFCRSGRNHSVDSSRGLWRRTTASRRSREAVSPPEAHWPASHRP